LSKSKSIERACESLDPFEVAARMIDFDQKKYDEPCNQVLDAWLSQARIKWARAANEGRSDVDLSDLKASLDLAERLIIDHDEIVSELLMVAGKIYLDGAKHPYLKLDLEAKKRDDEFKFFTSSLYLWARARGKTISEWNPDPDFRGELATTSSSTSSILDMPLVSPQEIVERSKEVVGPNSNGTDIGWQDVSIALNAFHKITFKLPDGKTIRANLEGTKLLDNRYKKLSMAGIALLGLATKSSIKQKKPGSTEGISSKIMTELRQALQNLSNIKSDPFYVYESVDGWKPKFRIVDRRNASDERAKDKAQHVQFDEAIHSPKTDKEYPYPEDEQDEAAQFLNQRDK
jgi:hypothetical protein